MASIYEEDLEEMSLTELVARSQRRWDTAPAPPKKPKAPKASTSTTVTARTVTTTPKPTDDPSKWSEAKKGYEELKAKKITNGTWKEETPAKRAAKFEAYKAKKVAAGIWVEAKAT